jgi:hypothetical protein
MNLFLPTFLSAKASTFIKTYFQITHSGGFVKKRSDDSPLPGNGMFSERSESDERKRRRRKKLRKSLRNKRKQKEKQRRRRKRPLGMLMMDVNYDVDDDSALFQDEAEPNSNYPANDYESFDEDALNNHRYNTLDKRFLFQSFDVRVRPKAATFGVREPSRRKLKNRRKKRKRFQTIQDDNDEAYFDDRRYTIDGKVDRIDDNNNGFVDNRFQTIRSRFDDSFKNNYVGRFQASTPTQDRDRYDRKADGKIKNVYVDGRYQTTALNDRYDGNGYTEGYQNVDNKDGYTERYQKVNDKNVYTKRYQKVDDKVKNEFDEFADDTDDADFKDVPYDPNVQFNYTPLDYENYEMDQVS